MEELPSSYRMEHNPDMVLKLGSLSLADAQGIQLNLLARAERLMNDINMMKNVIMEKWVNEYIISDFDTDLI